MSSSLLLFRRSLRRGWTTLLRETSSMASLPALTALLLLLHVLLLVGLGTQGMTTLLRTRPQLTVQMQSGIPDRSVQEFLVAATALPGVLATEYVTREKSLYQAREADPALGRFLDSSAIQNPFVDTVIVTLRSVDGFGGFIAFTRQPEWSSVVAPAFFGEASVQRADILAGLRLAAVLRFGAIALFAIMAVVLLVTVSELIRRRALSRKDDLFVARMAGASPAALRAPFVAEVSVLLIAAALFSLLILAGFVAEFATPLSSLTGPALWKELGAMLRTYSPGLLIGEIAVMVIVGTAGTRLALQSR